MEARADWRLRLGWVIVFINGIAFMAIAIGAATNPLPGEEDFLGRSFDDIQAADPQLANVIWHDCVAFGTLLFGVSLLIALLSWKGLARGSSLAWSAILVLASSILAFLMLAHIPIGNTSFAHFGIPTILALVLFVGLAISAPPVFQRASPPRPGSS